MSSIAVVWCWIALMGAGPVASRAPEARTPERSAGEAAARAPERAAPAARPVTARARAAAKSRVKVLDTAGVYHGNASTSTSPSVIEAQQVFDVIPEYREIVRRGLTEDDADYWVLLKKANKKFKAAVTSGAKKDDKDLVAEVGAIERTDDDTIPDITDTVVAEVDA